MKYAVEMGLDSMIYIPSFTKIGSNILKFEEGIHRQTAGRSHELTLVLVFIFSKYENYDKN
jgi:hypothetical protein